MCMVGLRSGAAAAADPADKDIDAAMARRIGSFPYAEPLLVAIVVRTYNPVRSTPDSRRAAVAPYSDRGAPDNDHVPGGKDIVMKLSRRPQFKITTSSVALAAAIALGVAISHPADSAAHDSGQAHMPMPGVADIVRDPTDLPAPIGARQSQRHQIDLETIELAGQLDEGTAYRYWTFNGQVPGPFVRVRVGDTVEVRLKNAEDSAMYHNVDFHAVTGPGGGGKATEAAPGEQKGFVFKALNPGLYVYHCATPVHAQHIANGMYGLILVEPAEGLPAVDREFYVMQGEIYTEEPFGTEGELTESYNKLINEQPEYFVFNGAVGALSTQKPLKAKVGETIRIYFGVGGPNATSSFHLIGEIFDKAYNLASLTGAPLTDVQTLTVPPGGAAAVDITLQVPGSYLLVDHALSRLERGLVGVLQVEGPDNPEVFEKLPEQSAATN
jgi:nitrite reductase (NO-forming)